VRDAMNFLDPYLVTHPNAICEKDNRVYIMLDQYKGKTDNCPRA
jgi:hypothetical protein